MIDGAQAKWMVACRFAMSQNNDQCNDASSFITIGLYASQLASSMGTMRKAHVDCLSDLLVIISYAIATAPCLWAEPRAAGEKSDPLKIFEKP